MKLGEQSELVCTSDYAYGDSGSPPKIPPKATLIFTVTLKWMKEKLNDDELLRWALEDVNKLKASGNDKFKAKEYLSAIELYDEALEALDEIKIKKESEDMKKLRITCLQNSSICLNALGHYDQSIEKCTQAIDFDKNAVKAIFLRSTANLKLQNFDDAITDVKEAIKLVANDSSDYKKFRYHWEEIKNEKKKHQQSQAKMMGKFLSEGIYKDEEPKT